MYRIEDVKSRFDNFINLSSSSTFKIFCENGDVIDYHISLNFDIEGKIRRKKKDVPMFKIQNYTKFIHKLTYLMNLMDDFHENDSDFLDFQDDSFLDYLILSYVVNMQEQDFNNPMSYIDKMINAYSKNYNIGKEKISGYFLFDNKKVEILEKNRKNLALMEAPLYKLFILKNEDGEFILPKIHFYISGDNVYITGIQNSKTSQSCVLYKKLNRYFRKVDAGLDEIERSSSSMPETIKDISPNFLVALTLFFSSMKEYKNFYMSDFLPLRYQNKAQQDPKRRPNDEELDRIESNVINKFLLTGARFCEHFDNATLDFNNGYLNIKMDKYTPKQGNIIYSLYESINSSKRN